jgi:TPR repeat protein
MTQLTLAQMSHVKSIISRLERRDPRLFLQSSVDSHGDDDISIMSGKSNYSTFFDVSSGVVRDRRLLIEERIRKSRLLPERILPRLKSKKSSLQSIDEYCVENHSDPYTSSSSNSNNNSERSRSHSREEQEEADEITSVVTMNNFDFKNLNNSKLCTIFAQTSPIYEQIVSQHNSSANSPNNSTSYSKTDSSHSNYSSRSTSKVNTLTEEEFSQFAKQYRIERSKTLSRSIDAMEQNKTDDEKDGDDDNASVISALIDQILKDSPQQQKSILAGQDLFLPEEDTFNVDEDMIACTLPSSVSSVSAASPFSKLNDDMNLITIINFLQNEIRCQHQETILQYSNILVKNGIAKVEVLKRRLLRDPETLLNLGFDEEMSDIIIRFLIQPEELQKAMKHAESKYNNTSSFYSATSSTANGVQYKFDILPTEVAQLYHKATQQNDINASNKLVELSADGNHFAQGFLMRMYAIGQGNIEKNAKQADEMGKKLFPWLKDLLIGSDVTNGTIYGMFAKYLMGVCYSEGLGTEKNFRESFQWYKQSAEQGYEAAQAYLAHCYYVGQGVVKDLNQAARWYQASASQGFAAAQCNLGICYELGEGVRQNSEEAVKWFILAAAQNDSKAQYNLARCYEKGLGVAKDNKKALYYYRLSADQGHPAAQYSVGLFYFNGNEAVEQSAEESIFWFQRSSALNYAPAQCKLGLCYEKGIGIEKDYEQAVHFYELSSLQGESSALYYLGYCYFNGMGVEKSYEEAIKYYRQSAEKNYAAAQNNLGYCYFSGIGIRKNYTEAIKWYRKSAEAGYPPAQYNMGFCYERGLGVTKKMQEMVKWYRLASKQGQKKASAALKRLNL